MSSFRRGQHDGKSELKKTGGVLVESMRDNIRQLNRSMQSIQKMITQSRRMIQESRESSLEKVSSVQRNSPYKNALVAVSPRPEARKVVQNQMFQVGSGVKVMPSSTKSQGSRMAFDFSSKFNTLKGDLKSDKHQENLIKFQPKNVKKEIQLRRSRNNESEESKMSTPQRTNKIKRLQNTPEQAYEKLTTNGNEVYKFSPQRTLKQKSEIKTNIKEIGNKIKIKGTPRSTTIKPECKYGVINLIPCGQTGNIRIEDDGCDQEENIQNMNEINGESTQKYRFKTEYDRENEADNARMKTQYKEKDSLDWNANSYVFSSPLVKNYGKNNGNQSAIGTARNKLNLRLFDNDSTKKQKTIPSHRQKLQNSQVVRSTPRQDHKTLVRELQKLQTESVTEQQRRAKFILKIRKYGFVQKYLSQSQIWSMYAGLVHSGIPQIKWPIHIVDEVYKKMKNVQ